MAYWEQTTGKERSFLVKHWEAANKCHDALWEALIKVRGCMMGLQNTKEGYYVLQDARQLPGALCDLASAFDKLGGSAGIVALANSLPRESEIYEDETQATSELWALFSGVLNMIPRDKLSVVLRKCVKQSGFEDPALAMKFLRMAQEVERHGDET